MKIRIAALLSLIANLMLALILFLRTENKELTRLKEEKTMWIASNVIRNGASRDDVITFLGVPTKEQHFGEASRMTYYVKTEFKQKYVLDIEGCVFNIVSNKVRDSGLILEGTTPYRF